ncbi:MAG: dienelactone hydrolase family protein [Thermodesulfobacteriota bacterium]|nr:MAG: dienelactone hydrolase family protein [Thermodesulfobacteriota bacterium]
MTEPSEKLVHIDINGVTLEGSLGVPDGASGIVLFAHGSGSSRMSPRNNFVAGVLRENGLATLLMDLLTAEEDEDYSMRFDIDLLTTRLEGATRWVVEKANEGTGGLKAGYFGSSTGAAAALRAAVSMAPIIGAVVSRGGRTDMADEFLPRVEAPTLLIVGESDDVVLELNKKSLELLTCKKELKIIPGATHLFEEPGALEEVAVLAADWFKEYLS